ncbi:hypothetical protein ACFSQD_15205 [Flavihumibacter stibioxidans]|uniref:DUF4123 domain-containing protein n=1 Tax=Flavihumibacter stibioxidans TaxID=1834163 RepID=A0ABR7M7U6_9BACT|nr:hypothetical protein [Flavihumibacter stibioxidans]MBC6491047.1 hypothetical protein [Flavihumibacter stibioxidans]
MDNHLNPGAFRGSRAPASETSHLQDGVARLPEGVAGHQKDAIDHREGVAGHWEGVARGKEGNARGMEGVASEKEGRMAPERDGSLLCYELKVLCPEALVQQLGSEQLYAAEAFGKDAFSVSRPGMLLARFYAREEMENTLLRWLNRVAGQQESFPVLFNNYGSMPACPLYIRVQDPGPFRMLAENLRVIDAWLKGNDCPAITLFHHPRLPLMDRLDEQKAMEILLEFSGRCFRAEMELEELILVSRVAGEERERMVSRLRLLPRGLRTGGRDE